MSTFHAHICCADSAHRVSRWSICPTNSGPSIYVRRHKCQNIEIIKVSTGSMKQSKQLVHHPKSLEPTLGEGDVIRSPPVPPGVLECLKEISREPEDMSGQLLAYWVF